MINIILFFILGVCIYALDVLLIYLYVDNVVNDFNCTHIKKIIKLMLFLPVVHLIFYPIMTIHGIVVFINTAYNYIQDI
ncbi:MAG: hypothetical protein [Wendovervirus sonii]|uniref:Uncharacterized protein n=1 Tax=phage Lak_Megaphage_Sonny TaxID=3109229 RepID=A0ABZ0Z3C5_9CAUD|nr:MAG: hypothetical protein [phage Lak_Megaphage_Sonny]